MFRHPDQALTSSLGVRLVTVDRPGYGLSDFQPRRRLLDWPGDVSQLADALGFDTFSVLGFSAGGPYALACAHQIPHRLRQVGIADSAPPMAEPEIHNSATGMLRTNYQLARHASGLLRLLFKIFWIYSRRDPAAFLKLAEAQSPPEDKNILSRPEFQSMLEQVWEENLRRDSRGYVQDIELLMQDWGFRLSEITQDIYLWQGEADLNTPPAWARYMAAELPHCTAAFFPNQAHFTVFAHWDEILRRLTVSEYE